MATRRISGVLAFAFLFLGFAASTARADINPVLTSAVSRKNHGGTSFDIPLGLTAPGSIECRRLTGTATIVLFFDQPVISGTATVTAGTGSVPVAPTFSGNAMTVQLAGLTDPETITLAVSQVTSSAGGTASASLPIRFLEGDSNASGTVNATDVAQVKSQVGQPITQFNFRQDLNQNGSVTASDVNIVKARNNKTVAGLGMPNTPPTIGTIVDQVINTGTVTVAFAVGDAEIDPQSLGVKATSDNPTLLPASSYSFGGSGATRTITITSAANQVGTANVTVWVGDGNTTATTTFLLTVNATPKLFLATMYPVSGVTTQGWGTSSLVLDGDETAATIVLKHSSLTTPPGAMEIRSPSATLLSDVSTLPKLADGSSRWVFPAGSAANIASTIKNNQAFLLIKSSTFATGEIQGTYQAATGSLTFSPPSAAALVTSGPTLQADASRFLHQATFGPSMTDITNLVATGYENWLTQQFNPATTPPTLVYPVVYQRCTTSSNAVDALASERVVETWWKNAITAPDQLRQRVATAYSEIFVVSAEDGNIDGQPAGLATYYDMLVNDAFLNFRTILGDVTRHPIMGQYLNMRGNLKPSAPNYTAPNENYAREIMQLFSIGLNLLNPDGTLKLDAKGLPIPTYDQNVIQGFAHVFTGWNTDPNYVSIPTSQPSPNPPLEVRSFYNKLMVVNAGNHSTYSKLLLNGYVIPQAITMDATIANAELDAALDNIFNHPNVGPFICRQLIQRLVCANPSPAYVYRVASVFNNDGTNVRGNMKAVIRAILLDPEARTPSSTMLASQGYGHLREPMLRFANVIRAFHPTSVSGYYKLASQDTEVAQTIFHATTVFNFFEPGYTPPGILDVAGLDAPEFQITYETTALGVSNQIYNGIYTSWKGSDVKLDLTAEANAIQANATTGLDALMDQLNLTLMSGQMPTAVRDRIKTFVNTITSAPSGSTIPLQKAKAAIHLTATSPQCATQR